LAPVTLVLSPGCVLPACDPRVAELHAYWRRLFVASDLLPARRHFDPTAVPRLLRWIWLVEVERHPLRFRYRLVGTEHVTTLGRDATGAYLDEVHPRFARSSAHALFAAAAERGEVGFYQGPPVYFIERDHWAIERLILPLAHDGRGVDMLLGITVFVRRDGAPA
jgi:hypothetical protein